MTRTSSKTYEPGAKVSVLVASLVTISSVFSTSTEASGDEPVFVGSRPSSFAAEEEVGGSVRTGQSSFDSGYVPSKATTTTESIGLEEQDLVSTLSVSAQYTRVFQASRRFREKMERAGVTTSDLLSNLEHVKRDLADQRQSR